MNIFDALNIFYREDTISDFLVNCFKDSNEFLLHFLNEATIYLNDQYDFNVETRVGLGKSIGTPDIVIRATIDNNIKLIIIENKMGAAEGHEQTNRYESTEARTRNARKYGVPFENVEFHLALDITAKPENSQFRFLNYQMFLKGNWQLNDEKLRVIFKDFQEMLEQFYSPIRRPYESLESDFKMDGMQRKICWQSILYETFYSNEDLLLSWGEVGRAGRNNFLFLITKREWTSNESFHEVGLSKTFNVHVDTYINMLDYGNNTVKEIGIRFETFPYEPHSKIKNVPGYKRFLDNKRIFGEKLYDHAKKQKTLAKHRNSKLLVMTIPIQGKTIQETVQNIKEQVEAIVDCIDGVIDQMQTESLIK
jgi:hypothetical protein